MPIIVLTSAQSPKKQTNILQRPIRQIARSTGEATQVCSNSCHGSGFGLYMILPSPMVYGVRQYMGGGAVWVVYCTMVVQQFCNSVGFARGGGGGQKKDDRLPQYIFTVKQYLVKANSG